jgi:hypothetical protein
MANLSEIDFLAGGAEREPGPSAARLACFRAERELMTRCIQRATGTPAAR